MSPEALRRVASNVASSSAPKCTGGRVPGTNRLFQPASAETKLCVAHWRLVKHAAAPTAGPVHDARRAREADVRLTTPVSSEGTQERQIASCASTSSSRLAGRVGVVAAGIDQAQAWRYRLTVARLTPSACAISAVVRPLARSSPCAFGKAAKCLRGPGWAGAGHGR